MNNQICWHLPSHLAHHFRAVYFGGNWTSINLQQTLSDVTWQQATSKIGSLDTILAFTYHINYYVGGVPNVFRVGPPYSKDKS